MAYKNEDNGVISCKSITSTSKYTYQGVRTTLNLYEDIDDVTKLIDVIKSRSWVKEIIIRYSPSRYVPKSITIVEINGRETEEIFLSTKEDHLSRLGGLIYQSVYSLGGDWSNHKLNYIFSRIRHPTAPPCEIVPVTSEVYLDGGDLPSWKDAPIRSSILLGGLVIWLIYLTKGVI